MLDDTSIEILSRLFKLLNDPNRLRIIFAIDKERRSVSEIMEATGLSQTLVSFHLRPLRESGILSTERKGAFIYYSLTEPGLIDLLKSLGGVKLKEEGVDEKKEIICPPMSFMRQWMGEKFNKKEV
ncbi:MAG TPA: metalloregulator ArsR/SmtB family transcription factor [Syntrophorhabdaceae bacterium]|nr:metalloregulator ArsR/SmtB family transcription factor [Syntrophorhabdaceae bacterium]HOL06209.1 metalloregulator ArsR/SmtB family transcription factor [Syntrophorhabdaceae bacterium]HON86402.1 metalloregulator ArsR/SmtB family transcription factor [Syntrophorhabdaceae bacterium]HOT42968.1 metalloregulator ArsR/SmtB family transcription factor [Syntrophorhabdaceae bacterium]HPP40981.1 metalloregulator ArsR/SmtB family transcription factor [Syntrophorhabdaceae bacterium]